MREPTAILIQGKKLSEILTAHGKWLRGELGVERANLEGAYLGGANLEGAYLERANLEGAYQLAAES